MKEIFKCIYNSYIGLFKYLINKKSHSEIWLFGGHGGELFDDNSRTLYEYVNKYMNNIDAYWVISKDSSSKEEIDKIGKWVEKGSEKNYELFYKSSVVIFSHSISSDIAPYNYVLPFARGYHYKVFKVFTGHGVDGFKKKNVVNGGMEKLKEKILKSYDMFTAVSDIEKDIKVNEWGIDDFKVKVTGIPRFDKLNYNQYEKKNKILYMPTWRNWIYRRDLDIEKTDYYNNIINLISHKKLIRKLNDENININICIHPLMNKKLSNIDISLDDNINILPYETNIQKEIIESRFLITDYSSVSWDSMYMKKPVIFFRFDIDRYDKEVGSYIDLKNIEYGKIAYNVEQCVEYIIKLIEDNKVNNVEYEHSKYFKYNDNKNCERIINYILKLKNN